MVSMNALKKVRIIAIVLSIAALIAIITLISIYQKRLSPFTDFAVVVDAGSTHSKIFVYQWPADKSDGIGNTSRVIQAKSCSVAGGPISDVTDPNETTLREYFQQAMNDCLSAIPATRQHRTLIFLGATAGLRLIELKDPVYINRLLNATRAYFQTLGLQFAAPETQVRIISGFEEGVSGWISANLLLRELYSNNKPLETYGVSDMGGASTQMSFVSPEAVRENIVMPLFETNYPIYSYSYLCYGTEQLRLIYLGQLAKQTRQSTVVRDPCLQKGYNKTMSYHDIFSTACARGKYAPPSELNSSTIFTLVGTGNANRCAQAIRARFDRSCAPAHCSWDNTYQPIPIPGSLRLIGISAWYSTFNNLAPYIPLEPNKDHNYVFNSTTLSQISAAIDRVCNEPWSSVLNPDRFRHRLCFNSRYHWTLFEYGFSMTDANLKNFQIVKTIDSNEIGWTLGYMINQTRYLDPEFRPPRLLTKGEFIGSLTLSIFVFILSVMTIIFALIILRRNQNTIKN